MEQARTSPPSPSCTVYWPEEYLAPDIPRARVWTYGYDADVIGGLFQANNKNSISQHGRDLSVRLEREIDDRVGQRQFLIFGVNFFNDIVETDCIRGAQSRWCYRQGCNNLVARHTTET